MQDNRFTQGNVLAGLNSFWAKLGIKQRNKHCPLPFRDAFYLSVNVPRKFNVHPQRKRIEKGNIGWPGPRALTSLLLSIKQKCDGKFNLVLQNNFRNHLVHSVTSLVILPNILTGAERGLIDFFIKLEKIFHCTLVLHLGDLKRRLVPERQVFAVMDFTVNQARRQKVSVAPACLQTWLRPSLFI